MNQQKRDIYSILCNKYKTPRPVIEVICNHPFKFLSNVISDEKDTKSVMFSYLFKVLLKRKYENDKTIKFNKSENKNR